MTFHTQYNNQAKMSIFSVEEALILSYHFLQDFIMLKAGYRKHYNRNKQCVAADNTVM